MKPKVLILEDDRSLSELFLAQLQGEPVEVVIAKTAAEARALFNFKKGFNIIIIALDAIVPSDIGCAASLSGPILAREFRQKGYRGPLIATSSNEDARQLTKREAEREVRHLAYACEKLKLADLIRELLGIYPTPSG